MLKFKGLVALLVVGLASSSVAADTLNEQAQSALNAALDDEYRAEAFYAAVIDKFGPARPFTNIINAEQRHSDAILTLMDAYGVSPPENTYLDDPEVVASVPDSIAEACRMGVQAELANRDLYDVELIPKATDYPDIVAVLQNLRDASQNRHLPAFQRCS